MPDSIRLSGWRVALVGLTATAALAGVLTLGSSGADAARGQTCQGQPADVVVGNDQTYVGGPADQVIVGSGGNEKIHARAGEDIICARGGNDLIGAGAGDDDLYGGNGSDLLRARRGVDFLDGDEEPQPVKRGQRDFDECHGHLPTPDPSPKGNDTATGCEFVANAFNLDTPDLSLSSEFVEFEGTNQNGTKLYFDGFGLVGGPPRTFTVTNNGTGASNQLTVSAVSGSSPVFVLSNDGCSGQVLAPGGSCTFDISDGNVEACPEPDAEVQASFDIDGAPNPYIHLTAAASCLPA